MIPWVRLAAVGVVLVGTFGGGAYFGWGWRDGIAAKADLARKDTEDRQRIRNADRAEWGARSFEEERDEIRRDLLASLPRVAPALAQLACPAGAVLAVGDVRIPGDALARLRAAAGEHDAADPGQPRPAVLPGAGAPGR